MRVKVYKNIQLHKWSIMAAEGPLKGYVVGHAEFIELKDVKTRINKAGQERAVREQKRNVHAMLEGDLVYTEFFTPYKDRSKPNETGQRESIVDAKGYMYYNPFRTHTFIDFDTGRPIKRSNYVWFEPTGKVSYK